MLRLDWNLLFNVMNLIILFFILKKFLIGPVTAIMEKRKALIEEQFQRASQAEQEANKLKEQYEISMQEVKKTSDEILEKTRLEAQQTYQSMVQEANSKAERTMRQAEEQIQTDKEQAMRQIQSEIGELAVLAATKLVAENLESGVSAYDNFLKKAGGTYDKAGR